MYRTAAAAPPRRRLQRRAAEPVAGDGGGGAPAIRPRSSIIVGRTVIRALPAGGEWRDGSNVVQHDTLTCDAPLDAAGMRAGVDDVHRRLGRWTKGSVSDAGCGEGSVQCCDAQRKAREGGATREGGDLCGAGGAVRRSGLVRPREERSCV